MNLPSGTDNTQNGPGSSDGVAVWHSRGYLPHFEGPFTQHVTFHLADSLPQELVRKLRPILESLPHEKRGAERRRKVEGWIDAGYGSCLLRDSRFAAVVQASLLHHDGTRYRLLAWVVMPNHVHALIHPIDGWALPRIVDTWKKYTSLKIGGIRRSEGYQGLGHFWQREYWDRYIRDEKHYWQVVEYIHANPVKACLTAKAEHWPWSSANFPGSAVR